jgi:hypothetical protein
MSAVIAMPELMADAATNLATIGDTLNTAHMTAAASTVTVLPAAADEVSASIAHLFSGYAQDYQKLAAKAAGFHAQFVQKLTASAGAYASAEAANVASLLQPLTAAAGSMTGAAAAIDPTLAFYLNGLNMAVSRMGEVINAFPAWWNLTLSNLGDVINALPGQWNFLMQNFLVDPVGTLPYLLAIPAYDAFYVSSPLVLFSASSALYVYLPLLPLFQALIAPLAPLVAAYPALGALFLLPYLPLLIPLILEFAIV